jgi:non-heme chloroperoxidase
MSMKERPMKVRAIIISGIMLLTGIVVRGQAPANTGPTQSKDASPHSVQFVQVENNVRLEVLDWGGSGPPVILLAGLGYDAHVYDTFAPKLTEKHHVYGITRRGFGASSAPDPDSQNYAATRLGEDVLAVMNALHLERPVLIGHSIAGEELSYIGANGLEKVAGLVYLDAGYGYAYYDESAPYGDPVIDGVLLRTELQSLLFPLAPKEQKEKVAHLLTISIPRFERDLQNIQKQLATVPDSTPGPPITPAMKIGVAIRRGVQRFEGVRCPVLAIYADPHNFGPAASKDPARLAQMVEQDKVLTGAQADAFQAGNPQARVIRIPNAEHFVFRSNEAEVLRDIDTFMASLSQ